MVKIKFFKNKKETCTTKIRFTEMDGKTWDIAFDSSKEDLFDTLNKIFQI